MAKITIIGSESSKNTALPPGVVVTVERTPDINKLIARGFVHVVPDPEPVAVTEPEPEPKPAKRVRRTPPNETSEDESDG